MPYKDPEAKRAYQRVYYADICDGNRSPRGKRQVYFDIETEHGRVIHKRCAGPCAEIKPVTEFHRHGASWHSRCKACARSARVWHIFGRPLRAILS
jgi:hypothetical protein